MSKEELVKANQAGPLVVPDFLKDIDGNEGGENVSADNLILPRLAICQSMSPQRMKNTPEYIAGLEEGDFFNTLTKDIYRDGVTLIPVLYQQSRIYFRPLNEGGGILCQSRNGINGGKIHPQGCLACQHSQFTDEGKPPCDLFMNMISLLVPPTVSDPQLILVSFKSTALRAAREWLTLLDTRKIAGKKKPYYTQVYEMRTIATKNKKGTYYTPKIELKRWVSPEEFEYAKSEYEVLHGRDINIDPEVDGEVVHADDAQVAF